MLRQAIRLLFDKEGNPDDMSPAELAQLGIKIRERYGQDYFTQLAIKQPITTDLRVVNGLRRKEEFRAIHDAGGKVILVITDIAVSVDRVLSIRQRKTDLLMTRDEILRHIQDEKNDLDPLTAEADVVIVNNFWSAEEFLANARQQIKTLIG